jgi:hypothetical protein
MCIPGGKKGSTKSTLGGQFRNQLIGLLDTLYKTEPHFIRCVKPNHQKVSAAFTVFLSHNLWFESQLIYVVVWGVCSNMLCSVACVQPCLRFFSSIAACCT